MSASRRNRGPRPPTPNPEPPRVGRHPSPSHPSHPRGTAPPVAVLAAAVGAAALLVYLPSLSNGFAYDAATLVEADERVHTLARPWRLLLAPYWPFGEENLALYRPWVTLSFAVDWALFRGQAWGFHLSNALAHALASVLLFFLLARLFPGVPGPGAPASSPTPSPGGTPRASRPGGSPSSPLPLGAAVGALLFALHPVHVEAVATIVGRSDVYVAAAVFAALLVWEKENPAGAGPRWGVPALFAVAVGSKESGLMLAPLLILWDAAHGRLGRARLGVWLQERALPLALMTGTALAYLALRAQVLGTLTPASVNPLMAVNPPPLTRFRTALQAWPEIVRLLVFPRTLLADYGPRILLPADTWTWRAVLGLGLLGGALGGGAWALRKGHARTALGLLWAPLALLPVSNLIVPIGVILAERTLYIAGFVLALGVAAGTEWVLPRSRPLSAVALMALAGVGALLAGRTLLRLPDWSDTDQVFRALMRDRPDAYRAHWHYARMAWRDGDLDAAAQYYWNTLRLWPYARPVYLEAGIFAMETHRDADARRFAAEALRHWPEDATFLRRLAVASLNLADTASAVAAMERGLKLDPTDPLLGTMREALRLGRPPGGG